MASKPEYKRSRSPIRRDKTKFVERDDTRRSKTRQTDTHNHKDKPRDKHHQSDKEGDQCSESSKVSDSDAAIDFGLSGKLASETNTFKGVCIKYSEPPEARIPKIKWRLYEFKGDESKNTLYIHRQSAYLIGRDRKVVDFPIDHPSCSKQHAVLQYRLVDYVKDDGRKGKKVKPYLIDLESTNGTFINDEKIEPSRYVEIKEKDIIKFGFSTREYVLLNENSNNDDVQ